MIKKIKRLSAAVLAVACSCMVIFSNPVVANAAAKYTLLGDASKDNKTINLTKTYWESGVYRFNNISNMQKGITLQYQYRMVKGGGIADFADGITVVFSKNRMSSMQITGGYMGLDGKKTTYGVEFDNYWDNGANSSDPKYNHIAIMRKDHDGHLAKKKCTKMTNQKWHKVKIVAKKNRITVYHDGTKVLTKKVSMSNKMYVAIVGSTGAAYCTHSIKNVSLKTNK